MLVKDVVEFLRKPQQITIITGAGASISAGIPTANQLIELINQKYPHCLRDLTEKERKDYGKVMRALCPSERENLIQPLLDKSRINWGHIALACLIKNLNVKRVLTFNFDLVLERAASLMSMHLPVYDFGVSPTGSVGRLAAPAIFHLHGQSYGLRLMNTDEETRQHAEALRPVLADSLQNHLTLVIGYSGEADGAFRVIEEELGERNRLIWMGHSKTARGHLSELLKNEYVTYVGECDFDMTMIALARGLGCFPPEIVTNPSQHVLDALQEVVKYPGKHEQEIDILTNTRSRLANSAEHWAEETSAEGAAQLAVVTGEEVSAGDPTSMTKDEKAARLFLDIQAGNELYDVAVTLPQEQALAKLAEAREKYLAAIAVDPTSAMAQYNLGVAMLREAERLPAEQAKATFAKARKQFELADKLRKKDFDTLFNWGFAYSEEAKLATGAEARKKYALAYEKYALADKVNPDHGDLTYSWGTSLIEEAEDLPDDEAFAKLEEAYVKFEAAQKINPQDSRIRENWGAALTDEARRRKGAKKAELFEKARAKLLETKALIGKPNYNFACLLALKGEPDAALDELEACLKDGTLPDDHHLEDDEDLAVLRDNPRFNALRNAV